MSPEEIKSAYEALFGPAFSRLSSKKSSEEEGFGERARRQRERSVKDNFEEKVVQIRRVTKVVKGGKQLSFRAVVIVGDKQGQVGVGVGKAKEVITAVQKSSADARRHLVTVPMTKHKTFPHRYVHSVILWLLQDCGRVTHHSHGVLDAFLMLDTAWCLMIFDEGMLASVMCISEDQCDLIGLKCIL